MARIICIMGESGAGKTTAMRNLDPETTLYIDADGKGLAWKDWRKQYNTDKKNYIATNDDVKIKKWMDSVNVNGKHIKTLVVDTLNGIMVAEEMRRMKDKGYDKWISLAVCVWDMVNDALFYRDDLTVIFICHSETDRDDNGYMFTRVKTSGKKLDKIVLESKFPTVLLAKKIDDRYVFETTANNSTAKSPMGALEPIEDNDIVKILEKMEGY